MPPHWRGGAGECRVFNPAVTMWRGRTLLAYRVITPDGRRRMAACVLDPATFAPVDGRVIPLSDVVAEGRHWHGDPRWVRWDGRLGLHFNTGNEPAPNDIYLLEIDGDTLEPRDRARPLVLDGLRQPVEKNWGLFEHDGRLLATYSLAPLVILELDAAGEGPVTCHPLVRHAWNASRYESRFGPIHGGAPPVRVGDAYLVLFNSAAVRRPWRPWRPLSREERITYTCGALTFSAGHDFSPQRASRVPVLVPPREVRPRLPLLHESYDRIAYASGAVVEHDRLLASFGLDNQGAWVASLDLAGLTRALQPVTAA